MFLLPVRKPASFDLFQPAKDIKKMIDGVLMLIAEEAEEGFSCMSTKRCSQLSCREG